MAEIIDFVDRRKQRISKQTFEELAACCADEIAGDWDRFSKNNRLNDYFVSCTPGWSATGINYLSDLNALSVIEGKIKIKSIVISPFASDEAQRGWLGKLKMGDITVSGPLMISEAYTRCFNILLFLKLGREILKNEIIIPRQ